MTTTRWLVLSLLASAALALGCADASDEEIPDETSDDSPSVDAAKPDPCADLVSTEDGVSTVSGADLTTPEAALAAYNCLRDAPRIDARVDRRGKPTTIEIPIK